MTGKHRWIAGAAVVASLAWSGAAAAQEERPELVSDTLVVRLQLCGFVPKPTPSQTLAEPNMACVVNTVEQVAEFHRYRAEDRQGETDAWAAGSSFAGAGLLIAATSGAAASTTAAWSAATGGSLLVHDLRASDHRGMLDVAGADALSDVAERYRRLYRTADTLKEAHAADMKALEGLEADCALLPDARTAVHAAPDDSRRTQVLAGMDELIARCDATLRAKQDLGFFADGWAKEQAVLADRAARDALDVVRRVEVLDRTLRASPMESFRATVASPFMTLGELIKGGNGDVSGRADPRNGRDYVVALRGVAEMTPVPPPLKTDDPITAAMPQAVDELIAAAKIKASGKKAAATEKAQPKALEDAKKLKAISGRVSLAARRLNQTRLIAVRLQAIDADRAVNVDPRKMTAKVDAPPGPAVAGPAPAPAQ